MKNEFSLKHVALFLLSVLLVASFSRTPNAIASSADAPVTHSEAQNQNPQTRVKSPLPPPTGLVNDYANLINPESEARLESMLTQLRDKANIEFAVVIIETTGEQSIFDYSLAVARGWGLGPKNASTGGGALLMLAMKDRKWRIQITDSLEKDLPNKVLSDFGTLMENSFRQGKYADGITTYVKRVIERLEQIRGFKLSGTR